MTADITNYIYVTFYRDKSDDPDESLESLYGIEAAATYLKHHIETEMAGVVRNVTVGEAVHDWNDGESVGYRVAVTGPEEEVSKIPDDI